MASSMRDLAEGFKSLGVERGDAVLIHSSLRSFGMVEGGARTVIEALLSAIGDGGTLLLPTLTGAPEDSPARPPRFDARSTPCWTGTIPETGRKLPGALRSLNPTHSVAALGARAFQFAAGHEDGRSPCDAASPYAKLAAAGGKILLAGVDLESCTSVHCWEEHARVPYHLHKEETIIPIVDGAGGNLTVRNYLHDWEKPETDFNKLEETLAEGGALGTGLVGESKTRILRADLAFALAVAKLRAEPLFLQV